MPDFLPRRDDALLAWTANFANVLTPDPAAFQLPPLMVEAFALRQQAFAQALAATLSPLTRTPAAILLKDQCRQAMVQEVRTLARMLRSHPAVTPEQRFDLGLINGRERSTSTELQAPGVRLSAVNDRTLRVQLTEDSTSTRRARPDGTAGAAVYLHLGDYPPQKASDWVFHSNQSRPRFQLRLGGNIPFGQQVWVTARWCDTRLRLGPAAAAQSLRILGGVEGPGSMNKAA